MRQRRPLEPVGVLGSLEPPVARRLLGERCVQLHDVRDPEGASGRRTGRRVQRDALVEGICAEVPQAVDEPGGERALGGQKCIDRNPLARSGKRFERDATGRGRCLPRDLAHEHEHLDVLRAQRLDDLRKVHRRALGAAPGDPGIGR